MKALVTIFVFAFSISASAQVVDQSQCAEAARSIAKQMFRGSTDTSSNAYAELTATAKKTYAENSELAYEVDVLEFVTTGHSDIFSSGKYKMIAKGNENRCEILSINKLAN